MKLRTHFFLFLLMFGMVPLLTAVVINLPFVMGQLEQFYQEAHLQNLRDDFRDLDQHLASRQEVARILAKLMEPDSRFTPGAIIKKITGYDPASAEWVGQILRDKLDIFQVLYLDDSGVARYWLERDPVSHEWLTSRETPSVPPLGMVQKAMQLQSGAVLVSPVILHVRTSLTDSRRLMTIHLFSKVMDEGEDSDQPKGIVVLSIDVGDMAGTYKDTLWVRNNGSYISRNLPEGSSKSAFKDFPGLKVLFSEGKLALFKTGGSQMIWVPMFETDRSGMVWVGREVGPSPVLKFRDTVTVRVLTIILVLVFIVLLVANWYAKRIDGFGNELTEGIGQLLEKEEEVEFEWEGPQELHQLGQNLNQLAKVYARNVRELRAHAAELEESNRYKSEFLANVSHELRTPLNSILLLSKMLKDPESNLGEQQSEQARVIHEAGVDLRSLIDNILDLSRIEAQEINFNLRQFEVSELVREVVDLMRPQFDAKGISLEFEHGEDAPEIMISDREKLGQVLKNFLSNSLKFTREGGVVIRLFRSDRDDAAVRPVAISVIDSGIGIPVHKLSVVFGAFKQVDGSTSRKYGGTGLGLSISKNLAELLGGRIVLWSKEGEGSVFTVLLPQEPETDKSSAEIEPDEVQPIIEPPAETGPVLDISEPIFETGCILIMDGDIQNLLTLTPLLEGWGLRVMAAGDAEEAIETLHEFGSDTMVLMDLMMLGIHGYGTINRIRGTKELRNIPVVAMVKEPDEFKYRQVLDAGASETIEKPVKPADLLQLLLRYMKTA